MDLTAARQHRYDFLATSGSGTVQRPQQAKSDVGPAPAALQHDLAAIDADRTHQALPET
jgi:hypothetical protein